MVGAGSGRGFSFDGSSPDLRSFGKLRMTVLPGRFRAYFLDLCHRWYKGTTRVKIYPARTLTGLYAYSSPTAGITRSATRFRAGGLSCSPPRNDKAGGRFYLRNLERICGKIKDGTIWDFYCLYVREHLLNVDNARVV